MTKRTIIFVILLLIGHSIFAQDKIESNKLLKDYDFLIENMDAHPAIYRQTSKEEFDLLIEANRQLLTKAMSVEEFYKIISFTLAKIKDGHTAAILPRFWLKDKHKQNGVFPYEVHVTDDNKCYIIKCLKKEGKIPVGAEILAIDNIPIDQFINKIDSIISYERIEFRNYIIGYDFETYLYLFLGKVDGVKIDYKYLNEESATINNIPIKNWKNNRDIEDKRIENLLDNGVPYEFEALGDSIGLLHIYAFSTDNLKKYKEFLRKMFRKIHKDGIHSLIIDLRGNLGGWPKVSSELLHYISDDHFKTMAYSKMKISEAYRNNFRRHYPNIPWNHIRMEEQPHSLDLQSLFTGVAGEYSIASDIYNEEPIDKRHKFKGNLFVLIDRESYSAASSFAATISCYQMGYLIGQTTGGTHIFSANSMYNKLPKSKILTGIATTQNFVTCFNNPDDGVKPHIEIKPSIIDLCNNIDSTLEYTKRLAKKKRKKQLAQ